MKLLTTMGLIWVLVLTIITTGCPKDSKTALEDGFAASVRVSSYGTDLTKGLTQLRHDGAITKDVFDGAITKLELVGTSGRTLHATLQRFIELYPDGNVPADQFKPIALVFNSDIYGPVIQLLGIVASLSTANQALLSIAMAGLKLAVDSIKRLMNRHAAYLGLSQENNYVTA